MLLKSFPPMGVYETLFRFQDATGSYMGEPGTHPWAQGFPLTTQLPEGPSLPDTISLAAADLKYPTATGTTPLRESICRYYNTFYGCDLTPDNVAVFAGGRPAIFATLAFLQQDIEVLIEETEYTPYYDKLQLLQRKHHIVPSSPSNRFRPQLDDYRAARRAAGPRTFLVKSNPCNPTGVTWNGNDLKELVDFAREESHGALFDEAYEFFHEDAPVSTLAHIKNIDETDIFVVGAATKGLQVPGMRTGWVVASRRHIEVFRNFSSIAMGGVSRPAQIYVSQLLEIDRVRQARSAVVNFYDRQRQRYGRGLAELGFELYTGTGGFYHWARLPGGLTADAFNERLFAHKAAVLPGRSCDMRRRGGTEWPANFVRFSFGPVTEDSYEENLAILQECL